MIPLSRVSQAALAAGLPARYQYWFGRSGRRYLFTLTEAGGIGDFAEAVAIVVRDGRIVWTGEVAALAVRQAPAPPDGALYIHLLAATPEERQVVIADLRPVEGPYLRLAA
jgi:hypothetical protein